MRPVVYYAGIGALLADHWGFQTDKPTVELIKTLKPDNLQVCLLARVEKLLSLLLTELQVPESQRELRFEKRHAIEKQHALLCTYSERGKRIVKQIGDQMRARWPALKDPRGLARKLFWTGIELEELADKKFAAAHRRKVLAALDGPWWESIRLGPKTKERVLAVVAPSDAEGAQR